MRYSLSHLEWGKDIRKLVLNSNFFSILAVTFKNILKFS